MGVFLLAHAVDICQWKSQHWISEVCYLQPVTLPSQYVSSTCQFIYHLRRKEKLLFTPVCLFVCLSARYSKVMMTFSE